jgi:hypothetical protein
MCHHEIAYIIFIIHTNHSKFSYFIWTSYNFCISTPISTLEATIFIIHNFAIHTKSMKLKNHERCKMMIYEKIVNISTIRIRYSSASLIEVNLILHLDSRNLGVQNTPSWTLLSNSTLVPQTRKTIEWRLPKFGTKVATLVPLDILIP